MRNIYFLIFCTFLMGCKNSDNRKIIISGHTEVEDIEFVNLKVDNHTIVDTLVNGDFFFEIENCNNPYIEFLGKKAIHLYVEKGDSLFLDIDSMSNISILGKGSEESNYLILKKKFDQSLGILSKKIDISLYSLPPYSFIERIDSVRSSRSYFLKDYIKEHVSLSKSFINMEKELINSFWMNQRFAYHDFHKMLTKEEVSLPLDYYHFVKDLNVNNTNLYKFKDYRSLLSSLLDYKAKEVGVVEPVELLKKKFSLANKLLTDQYMIESVLSSEINRHIDYNGINGIDSLFNELIPRVSNIDHKNILNDKYDDWTRLEKGNKALDFQIVDEAGRLVRLSDFIGKPVYIICWNSCCGPCLAEMPIMNRLTSELTNKGIVFISISTDTDRDRWLDKIKEFEMKTLNLCTDGSKHQFYKDYIVRAVPRYILIDKNGLIIDAAAPKPSVIMEQLEKLVSSN